jgi:ComF family protein
MLALVRALAEVLAGAVAPNRCAACDADVPFMTAFCGACASTLSLPEAHRDATHLAAFVYGGAIAQAIHRLKFDRRPDVARPLAAALRRAARILGADPPGVVLPVPLYPRRLVERGYNQAALLAAPVAKDLRAVFLPRGLLRRRDTEEQKALERAARLSNLDGAFEVRRPNEIRGQRVLLVDDVRTTGATLEACSKPLLEAGAKDVRTLVVAQTERIERDRPPTRTRARA